MALSSSIIMRITSRREVQTQYILEKCTQKSACDTGPTHWKIEIYTDLSLPLTLISAHKKGH